VSVRTADGLEAIARAASPAALARAFGERCCAVCTPAGSDNCNCCGKVRARLRGGWKARLADARLAVLLSAEQATL
jgi:hypothetical protein